MAAPTHLLPLWACRSLAEPLPTADVRAANFAALDPTAEGGLVSCVGIVDAVVNAVGDGRPNVGLQSRNERSRIVVTGASRRRRVESPRNQRAKSGHARRAFVQRPGYIVCCCWMAVIGVSLYLDIVL